MGKINENGQELARFINWIKENPDKWECLRNPEGVTPDVEMIKAVISNLIEHKIYTVAFLAVNSLGCMEREMELIQHRITMESYAEMPEEELMETILRNVQ